VGLALARQLVELHGGSLEARSEGLGKGSEFVVRVPLQVAAPPAAREGEGQAPLRVLVVDDSKELAESVGRLLEFWGYDMHVAYDGPTGLELARLYRPEVVLLDLRMPGMDGYEVARRLRQGEGSDAPVLVAMTGYASEEDEARTQQAGFHFHVRKPAPPGSLRDILHRVAAAVRPAGGAR
jgi:CheY-like chemotaxis protein